MNQSWLMILIFLFPLLSIVFSCFRSRWPFFPALWMGSSLIASCLLLIFHQNVRFYFEWLPNILISFKIDRVSTLLLLLVTFVSAVVHLFSLTYMEGDEGKSRYFAKLGFFTWAMLGLLIANDLISLFVFWELVGFASYLLIGFWYKKDGVPSSARLAFMVNRMADVLLLIGILWVNASEETFVMTSFQKEWLPIPSLLVVVGAFGKSAQVPFSGWLTKAMVGPTPVSALVHAATMVAAGVYLLYRVAPFMPSVVLTVVAVAGATTALYGGISAIGQNDIKRVLAYSTISQLGYMVAGIGVGAGEASLFHLWTHAFFKAGLFLGAGSVIHYLHWWAHKEQTSMDTQDMRLMGGLQRKLPWTYGSFLVCSLALAGAPFFSGFLSKEGIILSAWSWADTIGTWAYLVPDSLFLAALLTAFYVTRMFMLVFYGESRTGNGLSNFNYRENWKLTTSLVLLSLGTCWFFYQWNPFGHPSNVLSFIGTSRLEYGSFHSGFTLYFSTTLAAGGIMLAYFLFRPGSSFSEAYKESKPSPSVLAKWLYNGCYLVSSYERVGKGFYCLSQKVSVIDRKVLDSVIHFIGVGFVVASKGIAIIDRLVVDGIANLFAWISQVLGKVFSGMHSRRSQDQLFWLILAFVLILGWILFF